MIFKKTVESLIALIIGLAVAYGMLCAYAYFLADGFIFAKSPPTYAQTADYTSVTSTYGDKITLLHLINPTARYTILYSHGNLEDLGFIRPRLEVFRAKGFSILAYDYPGFGTSSGIASEQSLYASAEAAYNYLIKDVGLDPRTIILYGRSMGGGATAYLASRHKVAGVVMQSTFVSAFRVQTGIKILPWDRFDNVGRMPLITSPIFFVHGLADETMPVWHSQMMQAATRVPTRSLWVPYALHNNVIEIAREDYWKALDEFTKLLDHSNGFDTTPVAKPSVAAAVATPNATPADNSQPSVSVAPALPPAAVISVPAFILPAPAAIVPDPNPASIPPASPTAQP